MQRRSTVLLLSLMLVLVLTACASLTPTSVPSGDEVGSTEMAEEQVLNMGAAFVIVADFDEEAYYIGDIVHGGGLLNQNADGSLRPWAADSWEVSDDGLVYTFHLNPSLKWCTGEPVTASDLKWSSEWLNVQFKWAKDYAWYMVDGIDEFLDATTELSGWQYDQWQAYEISGLQALDDQTLQITLAQPTPAFLDILASGTLGTWAFFDPQQVQLGTEEVPWEEHPEMCGGFGPFMVDSYDPVEQKSVLVPNPYYVLGEAPKLQQITVQAIEDLQTQVVLYESGDLDFAVPSTADLAQFTQPGHPLNGHVRSFSGAALAWLEFDMSKEPVSDPKIREAIWYSIDMELIQETIFRGIKRQATGLLPAGDFYRDDEPAKWQADPERARQAVADSTYGAPENVPPILYWSRYPDPHWAQVAQAIQQMVKENAGLDIQITTASSLDAAEAAKYHIYEDSYGSYSMDPQAWGETLFATDGPISSRWAHWGREETDALLEQVASSAAQDERLAAWRDFEDIVWTEYWMIPLYWDVYQFLVQPEVKNLTFSPTFRLIDAEKIYIAAE